MEDVDKLLIIRCGKCINGLRVNKKGCLVTTAQYVISKEDAYSPLEGGRGVMSLLV